MCFIQYAVQKNLLLTIENEEKKKKKLASISVKNLQFILIIFFFCGKTTNLPSFIPGKNLIFFKQKMKKTMWQEHRQVR